MPVVSSYAVTFLIGAVLTLGGLLAVLFALPFRRTRIFVWMLLAALFPLCAGLFLLIFPASGFAMLTYLIAAILVVSGVACKTRSNIGPQKRLRDAVVAE